MTMPIRSIQGSQMNSLAPRNFQEAWQFAEIISKSSFCPRELKNNPGDILLVMQAGHEVGAPPLQAIQNIAIINGKLCMWGDLMLALCKAYPGFEDLKEWIENGVAYCLVKRRGHSDVIKTFSLDDAKKANLIGKSGPWAQYTERMLQMRARGFALRDMFPDVIKGLITREEAEDYENKNIPHSVNAIDVTPKNKVIQLERKNPDIYVKKIEASKCLDALKEEFKKAYFDLKDDGDAITLITSAKDKRKTELEEVVSDIAADFFGDGDVDISSQQQSKVYYEGTQA